MANERLELVVSPIKEMPALTSNIDELKGVLEVRLDRYRNLVVTEDGIKDAKSDRANLNKLKKSIADERIAQKKRFLTPFETFEKKCKEVEKLIDDTATSIDVQIKAFDEMEKKAKKKEIVKIYEANFEIYKGIVPLDKLWDEKWLNKTFKLEDVETTIKDSKVKIDKDIEVLDGLTTNFPTQTKDVYFSTLDLAAALAEEKRLTEHEKALAELKARQEAERAARMKEIVEMPTMAEPVEKQELADQIVDAFDEIYEEEEDPLPYFPEQELVTMTFKVEGTKAQLAALARFMVENGIKYGRV